MSFVDMFIPTQTARSLQWPKLSELPIYSSETTYQERKPHKCPVCEGSGKYLPTGEWTDTCTDLRQSSAPTCHGCQGSGIVWG